MNKILIALFVVMMHNVCAYDYRRVEDRRQKVRHLERQADAAYDQNRAIEKQTSEIRQRNRLIAAMALCAGAVAARQMVDGSLHPRVKMGATVVAAAPCLFMGFKAAESLIE